MKMILFAGMFGSACSILIEGWLDLLEGRYARKNYRSIRVCTSWALPRVNLSESVYLGNTTCYKVSSQHGSRGPCTEICRTCQCACVAGTGCIFIWLRRSTRCLSYPTVRSNTTHPIRTSIIHFPCLSVCSTMPGVFQQTSRYQKIICILSCMI